MKKSILYGIVIASSMTAGYWLSEMNRFANGVIADTKTLNLHNIDTPMQSESSEDFQNFIWQFATDSAFQFQRIQFPLAAEIVNDEFETESRQIEGKDWEMSYLFANKQYRIQVYDNWEARLAKTNQRLFVYHGIENGIRIEYHFELLGGKWFLIKFADYST
ncbi:MAG: DUF4348 domain-containing protein [Cyclobacteriaceae bacterium]